jgi:hypothetical protein
VALPPGRGRSLHFQNSLIECNATSLVEKVNFQPNILYKNSFKQSSKLNCLYTNATSLGNKWSALNSLLAYQNYPHVILITETWFHEYSIVNLENYKLYNKNREFVRGGGVAIYVRNDIESFEAAEAKLQNFRSDQVWCKIKIGKELILVGCVYRPPFSDTDINNEINKSIGYASKLCSSNNSHSLLVAGDFNYPDILWHHAGGICKNKGRPSSLEFIDNNNKNYLTQHVLEPTFQDNTLDLVITDDPARVYSIQHGPPLGATEKDHLHSTLTWDYELQSRISQQVTGPPRPVLAKGDYCLFDEKIRGLFPSSMVTDVDIAYNQLVSTYSSASKLAIPTRRHSTSTRTNKKWFNAEIHKLTKRKYKLHCRIRSAPDNIELKIAYKETCRQVKVAVNKAVFKYEAAIVRSCKQQPKLLFSYINDQKACKDSIKGLVDANGVFQTDGKVIVNLLNEQFSSVFNPRSPALAQVSENTQSPEFKLDAVAFSPANVRKYINGMNAHKSPGMDCIHPFVIKKCPSSFAAILSAIFSRSFVTSKVPDCWKRAQVTPIFKKGKRSIPSNYRAVSLTATPCRLMERIIRDGMMDKAIDHCIITAAQHGFVLNKSTITNLLETVDIISESFNNGLHVLIVFLDFAKAFDMVCHESLCIKLKNCGFGTEIVNWISDFLTNRKQRVVIGDNIAEWKDVTSGVPQGSVLGPLLFVIYINDMPEVVKHLIKLFADDSKLVATIRNVRDLETLQKDLDALTEWSKTWKMLFNVDKCKIMEFSRSGKRKYQDTEFLMGDPRKALIHIDTERDLGVTLSSSLKFSKHINIQANKATGILGQLRRTFRHWNIDTFKTLYCAFVRPHLEYAAVVWSPSSKKDIRLLENVQRRATKLIPRIRNWNYSDRLRVLGLTSLQDRRKRGDLIQLFKISNGFNVVKWVNPIPTSNSLLQTGPASAIRGHQRRLSGQNSTKCIQRENFFTNRVINDWNSLPVNVIASNTINQFKNSYDNWKSGV